jgi:hypothetical protein
MDFEHPILSTEYRLMTPTLMAVIQIACFKVMMRKTGVVFTGEPRIGKTRCCEALVDEIPKKFKNVYAFLIPASNKDKEANRASIIHQLIDLEKIKPPPRTPFIQRQAMLVERLKLRAASANAKQIVMLIDELQRLSSADFHQLADIYNKLRGYNITLTVISFAMPSIERKIVEFLESDDRHIIGRFLSEVKPLYGITSKKDLSVILSLYDTDQAFPEASSDSFTKNVLPKAYASGFRLADLSDDLWREMSKVAVGKYVANLPMEHVTQTVAYLFLVLSHEDNPHMTVPTDLIEEAIIESNFKEFCRSIDTGDKK